MYKVYQKIMAAIVWVFTAIVYFSMAFIPLILSAQVIGRKFLRHPILGAEELAGFAFTAMVLFGCAVVCYRKKYIVVDVFVKGMKGRPKGMIAALADILTLVCYGVLIYCFNASLPALRKFKSGIFGVPKNVYAIALMIVFIFMFVRTVEYVVQDLKAVASGENIETKGSFG